MTKGTRAGVCLFVAATWWGCAALPDVTPFVTATSELRRSTKAGFGAVRDELETMSVLTDEAQQRAANEGAAATEAVEKETAQEVAKELGKFSRQYRQLARRVGKARAIRAAAMGGFRAYASSIARIVAAGDQGRESVDGVAGSLDSLLGVFGAAPMSGTIVDLASAIGGEVIRWRAMTSLEQALEAADPTVQKLAAMLADDTQDLADALVTKPDALWAASSLGNTRRLAYRKRLVLERERLTRAVAALPAGTGPEPEVLVALVRIGTLLGHAESWYGPIRDRTARAGARLAQIGDLLRTTGRAIRAWARAHGHLVKAVKERKPHDLNRLIDLTMELKEHVEELRR